MDLEGYRVENLLGSCCQVPFYTKEEEMTSIEQVLAFIILQI